jgi:hypothetical protein
MSNEEANNFAADGTAPAAQQITIVAVKSTGSRAMGKRDIVEKTMDIASVREGFVRFLNGLSSIISDSVPAVGTFELDEVQFSAEISADGEFKLLGTGVGVEATTGVTFTMRRRKSSTAV